MYPSHYLPPTRPVSNAALSRAIICSGSVAVRESIQCGDKPCSNKQFSQFVSRLCIIVKRSLPFRIVSWRTQINSIIYPHLPPQNTTPLPSLPRPIPLEDAPPPAPLLHLQPDSQLTPPIPSALRMTSTLFRTFPFPPAPPPTPPVFTSATSSLAPFFPFFFLTAISGGGAVGLGGQLPSPFQPCTSALVTSFRFMGTVGVSPWTTTAE